MANKLRIKIIKHGDTSEMARLFIEPQMRNLGNAIARRMQRVVPKRTWALHDSVQVETVRTGAKVKTTVGAGGKGGVNYALHVERGTSRAKAQPFMRPALLQSRASDLTSDQAGPKTHGTKAQRRSQAAGQRRVRKAEAAED